MGKFHSDWIERNVYLRPVPKSDPKDHHYETYERPVIVCLCGSTRFKDAWYAASKSETYAGRIVLSVGDLDTSEANRARNVPLDEALKTALDELHKRKIDLADEVLVLNCPRMWCLNHERWTDRTGPDMEFCCANVEPRGYVGESTRSEIRHAIRGGKTIRWLETDKVPEEFAAIG